MPMSFKIRSKKVATLLYERGFRCSPIRVGGSPRVQFYYVFSPKGMTRKEAKQIVHDFMQMVRGPKASMIKRVGNSDMCVCGVGRPHVPGGIFCRN